LHCTASARTKWLTRLSCTVILLYNDSERKLAEDCVHRMVKRAVEMEGTVTVSTRPPPSTSRLNPVIFTVKMIDKTSPQKKKKKKKLTWLLRVNTASASSSGITSPTS
jgi:hypothetical protein